MRGSRVVGGSTGARARSDSCARRQPLPLSDEARVALRRYIDSGGDPDEPRERAAPGRTTEARRRSGRRAFESAPAS